MPPLKVRKVIGLAFAVGASEVMGVPNGTGGFSSSVEPPTSRIMTNNVFSGVALTESSNASDGTNASALPVENEGNETEDEANVKDEPHDAEETVPDEKAMDDERKGEASLVKEKVVGECTPFGYPIEEIPKGDIKGLNEEKEEKPSAKMPKTGTTITESMKATKGHGSNTPAPGCSAQQSALSNSTPEAEFAMCHVHVKTNEPQDNQVEFKIKKSTTMGKWMLDYCRRHGLQASQVRFMIDGERIAPDHTAEKLGLENNDTIEVWKWQKGGGRPDPLPGQWTPERISRRLCSFGRYDGKRPRGLSVTNGRLRLDELVRYWGEEQQISGEEIMATVRKHEKHANNGGYRFKIEDDGHGSVVIRVMDKRSTQEAEQVTRTERTKPPWQRDNDKWVSSSSSSWQTAATAPEETTAETSDAERKAAKEVVLRSALQVEQTTRSTKRTHTDDEDGYREWEKDAVSGGRENDMNEDYRRPVDASTNYGPAPDTQISIDNDERSRETNRQIWRHRAATFYAHRDALMKTEEEATEEKDNATEAKRARKEAKVAVKGSKALSMAIDAVKLAAAAVEADKKAANATEQALTANIMANEAARASRAFAAEEISSDTDSNTIRYESDDVN